MVTGADLIKECISRLKIDAHILASLLCVTNQTLTKWYDIDTNGIIVDQRFKRLQSMREVIRILESFGVDQNVMLNYLNEEISVNTEESLLYFIINYPEHPLIPYMVYKVVQRDK